MKAHLTFSLTALTVELTEIYSQTSPGPLDDSIERVRRKLSEALEVVSMGFTSQARRLNSSSSSIRSGRQSSCPPQSMYLFSSS
jgi:hypothetical protein